METISLNSLLCEKNIKCDFFYTTNNHDCHFEQNNDDTSHEFPSTS